MAHWNYRVLREDTHWVDPLTGEGDVDICYSIVECYYDDDGSLSGYADASPSSVDSPVALGAVLEMMQSALTRKVLTPDDFKGG